MSDTTRLIGQLKAWIESPSGFRALDGFVQTNLNRLTAGGSSALFSLQSEQHNFNRDDTKGNVEELRQEFVAFFMDEIERRLQRQPVLASHLQKGNFRFFLTMSGTALSGNFKRKQGRRRKIRGDTFSAGFGKYLARILKFSQSRMSRTGSISVVTLVLNSLRVPKKTHLPTKRTSIGPCLLQQYQ
jgi:hypothetical protein